MLSPEQVFVKKSKVRTLKKKKNKKRSNDEILEEVVFLSKVVLVFFAQCSSL